MESSCLTWIFAGELNLQPDFGTTQPWLTTDTSQVASSGIVSVTVDSSKLTDNTLKVIPDNGLCEPHTFCKPSGTTCGSALDPKDPLYSQSVAVCTQWAVEDLDCPPKGCYGFSITIPKTGFKADATLTNPSPHRPAPAAFPTDAINQGSPTWLVKFLGTTLPPDSTEAGNAIIRHCPPIRRPEWENAPCPIGSRSEPRGPYPGARIAAERAAAMPDGAPLVIFSERLTRHRTRIRQVWQGYAAPAVACRRKVEMSSAAQS